MKRKAESQNEKQDKMIWKRGGSEVRKDCWGPDNRTSSLVILKSKADIMEECTSGMN